MKKIDSFTGEFAFLSNFWLESATTDANGDTTVVTNEHRYQAAKAVDDGGRELVLTASTPGKAKRWGKKIVMRPDWEQVKVDVMMDCLRKKFRVGSDLAEKLLATGGAVLIEGNTWGDTEWGQVNGVGKNLLGICLMKIRGELGGKDGATAALEQIAAVIADVPLGDPFDDDDRTANDEAAVHNVQTLEEISTILRSVGFAK